VPISAAEVVAFVARPRPSARRGIGFFEWTLALAVDAFHARGVELAVVEAGVGARADATMALPGVVGTVLTNVDLDHVETLGPTLLDIARDKAAVARPGVPLVTGARGEALALVLRAAEEVGAPVWAIDADHALARWPAGGPELPIGLAAHARRERAPGAGARPRARLERGVAPGRGLAAPPPPARFERFSAACRRRPTVEVVLDGAHDPAAAARLAGGAARGLRAGVRQPRAQAHAGHAGAAARAGGIGVADERGARRGAARRSRADGARAARADLEAALAAACAAAAGARRPVVVAGIAAPGGHARPWLRRRARSRRARGGCYAHRPMGRVGFVSLGCPKALVDSERILTELRADGYDLVRSYEEADLVVVNTCGFITPAVEESLAAIGEALDRNGRVVVTGCLGERPEEILARHPSVLAVTGPGRRRRRDGRRARGAAARAGPPSPACCRSPATGAAAAWTAASS
jgi:hypothetical protein